MKNILVILLVLCVSVLHSQTNVLLVKGSDKGPYVEHKVAPKENFYSIGRMFNVHPKHLALFNSLDMTKGLSLGQVVRIPLSDTNFNQKASKGVPVYYVTGNSEGLYHVSAANKNVLMEKLRQWNHLTTDKVPPGSKLIVGFLVVNDIQATAVTTAPTTEVVNKPAAVKSEKDVSKNPAADKVVPKKEDVRQQKDETNKKDSVIEENPEVTTEPLSEGYFKDFFEQQVRQQPISKEKTLTSGIFKTSNGWSDAKYYLLMDGAAPGTIIRITNPGNNKIIYAKLLGEMNGNGSKQNQGLSIRISNAAASALDISETEKFIVKLNY